MSTSLKVVSSASVCCASTSRRAIVARRLDMRSRVSPRVDAEGSDEEPEDAGRVTPGDDSVRLVTTGSACRGAGAVDVGLGDTWTGRLHGRQRYIRLPRGLSRGRCRRHAGLTGSGLFGL